MATLLHAPRHGAGDTEPFITRARRRQRPAPAPRGLWSTGLSCHIGAAITSLSALPALRYWVRRADDGVLVRYLLDAAGAGVPGGPLDPRPVAALLELSGWKPRYAQDAHETLSRILDLLEAMRPRRSAAAHQATLALTTDDEP